MDKGPDIHLGKGIKRRLLESGINDVGMARAIGVSLTEYVNTINEKEPPSIRFIAGLINAGVIHRFKDISNEY